MVSHIDDRPPAVDQGLYGVTFEEQNKMLPSQALAKILKQAQDDHRTCVIEARKADLNLTETCALTWGNVWYRYRQWAEYRAPFKTHDSVHKWGSAWYKILDARKAKEAKEAQEAGKTD